MISDSGKYSGFGYPDIRIPVEITSWQLLGQGLFTLQCYSWRQLSKWKKKLPIMIARVSLHLLHCTPKVSSTLMKGVRENQRVGQRLSRKGPHGRTLTGDNVEEARARIPTSLRNLPRASSHTNDNHCTDRFPGRLLARSTLTKQTMNNCLDQNVNFHVVKVVPSAPGHSQKKEISPGVSECYTRNHTLKSVKSVSCVTQWSCVKPVTNVTNAVPRGQTFCRGQTSKLLTQPNLTTSPTVISCYVNPHRNLYLLEALHQFIDKNAVKLV